MDDSLSRYSLEELVDMQSRIDRDAYPERYAKISELAQAKLDKLAPATSLWDIDKDRKLDKKYVFLSLARSAFVSTLPIICIFTGVIFGRRDREIVRADDPIAFWITICMLFLIASIPLLLLAKKVVQTHLQKPNNGAKKTP